MMLTRIKSSLAKHRKLKITVGILLAFLLFAYYFLIQPALSLYAQSKIIPLKARPLIAAFTRQDYPTLEFELKYFREELIRINQNTSKIAVISPIPFIGPYAADLKRISGIALEAYDATIDFVHFIVPVLPTIKFSGWVPGGSLTSVNPSLDDITRVLPLLSQELPKYKEKISSINKLLSAIDENRYPVEIRGRKVREKITQLKDMMSLLSTSFDDIVKILPLVPEAIGVGPAKNYLIIVQNDKELRPGGGLLSGYAFLTASKGRFGLVKSGDMFFLDDVRFGKPYPAPAYLTAILGSSDLRLRDANFSPDFTVSAKAINEIWMKTPKPFGLEGIIVIDTHLLKSLVKVLGDIKISDTETVTEENIDSTLQNFFRYAGDRSEESRKYKGLVSTILNEILKKSFVLAGHSYNTPLKPLLEEGRSKHLLMNFYTKELQEIAENRNLAGSIKQYSGDYLHVNNAIYAPKRNAWKLNQSVTKSVELKSDRIVTTLKIETEGLPIPPNSDLNNKFVTRIYVPKDSKLIGSSLPSDKITQEGDLGKTVFSTVATLEPNKKISLEIKYESPVTVDKEYKLLIQKQPGTDSFPYKVIFGGKTKEFNLDEDREVSVK